MRRSTIILVFVVAGCDEVPDELDDPGLPAISDEDSRLATPLDQDGMDSLFRRTRFAFRERDGVLRGGDATSGAEITSQGVAVTPYNWPRDAVLDRGRPTDATGVLAGAPLRLETSRIARATAPASSRVGARTLRVAPDGAAELRGDEGTEVVRNVDGGIEQSWRFDAAPVGDGDLTVRVAVSGQMYGGRTSSGLHFYDPVTGLGFRYSDAVWIDADGNRTPLVAEFETGEIVLNVPGEVVRTSRYPAILDPTVGAELGYDNPVYGPATQGQYQPDIAFSGSLVNGELFVVWADYRRDTTFTSTVFGARVRASGDVVDVVGMVISNEPGDQRSPAVAWGDDRDAVADRYYLVVWEDPIRVASDQIRGRLVHDDGTFVNTAPFSLQLFDADNGSGASQPDVAFHHFHDPEWARFFVTWRRSLGGVRVRSYSLEPNGVIAQSGANATQGSTAATPAMACAYPLCLVVWSESSNIYGRSVGQFGDFGPAPPTRREPSATI